ncbi:MAG: M48 family metallopeptidase [Eubacterium sp.]|nr:M48 family metallopeptidase [Eubacterium sp.]
MKIEIIKSKRKTISIQIIDSENVKVRAPYRVSKKEIQELLDKNKDWIDSKLEEARESEREAESVRTLSDLELSELAERARDVFKKKVEYYAPLVGVTWNGITIRNQKTRWGSCSSKGNLNFNVALMRAPIEVLDYVVVHELCHRLEMNHSKKFWHEVERVMPEYRKYERWLKDNGKKLMAEVQS